MRFLKHITKLEKLKSLWETGQLLLAKSRNNVRCLVRDEADNPVLAADLKTGQFIKKLSENSSAHFLKYLLKVDAKLAAESSKFRVADAQL